MVSGPSLFSKTGICLNEYAHRIFKVISISLKIINLRAAERLLNIPGGLLAGTMDVQNTYDQSDEIMEPMSSSTTESFQVLSESDVSDIIRQLQTNLPNSYHALCFVMSLLEFKTKVPDFKGDIYAPNGDYSDGTFLIYFSFSELFGGTYYSITDRGCERLRNALETTRLFQDTNLLLMTAVHDRVHRAVGTVWCKLDLDGITPCYLYWISAEDALKFNPSIPNDVEIRNLKEEDAELVNSLWPHRSDWSLNFIRQNIKYFPTVGLYRKSDHKLLSWVLKWFYGGLGLLQTVEEAKRRGYAQIVVEALSARLANDNFPIHATVLANNNESNPLFHKMGFRKQFLCHYIEFRSKSSKKM